VHQSRAFPVMAVKKRNLGGGKAVDVNGWEDECRSHFNGEILGLLRDARVCATNWSPDMTQNFL
jgi:hypothetical protein